MDSLSRRYYEHQLGAGMGPEFSLEKLYGYTEPVRRLIQREESTPQANEIPNTMPSWLPGDDYLINFRKGDPFSKIDQGYARLPGAGYAGEQDQVSPSLATTRSSRARAASRPAVDSRCFHHPLRSFGQSRYGLLPAGKLLLSGWRIYHRPPADFAGADVFHSCASARWSWPACIFSFWSSSNAMPMAGIRQERELAPSEAMDL